MPGLGYEEVSSAILVAVPEIKDRYERSAAWQAKVGGHPGHYEVVEAMLQPLLKDELDMGQNPALLRRIFDFFDQMAGSSDLQVVNLLQVGIFENLVGYPNRLVDSVEIHGARNEEHCPRDSPCFPP